jgi:hypothetical protein
MNAFPLCSPSPTISCPYCPRWFHSRGGRTQHIQALHQVDESEPPEFNPPVVPSPLPHLLHSSSQPPSPISSGSVPARPPPSDDIPRPFCRDLDSAGLGLDVEGDNFDLGYVPPDINSVFGDEAHEDAPLGAGMSDCHVPDAPQVTRIYHRKLDGKSIFFKHALALTLRCIGRICDESGNNIPLGMPPSHSTDKRFDDWTPYNNRLQFEVADFLYRRNQMSAGDINCLLSLWAASLAIHGDEPPFSKASHLYDTIDSTPLGDVTWESFGLQYNGPRPAENVPSWMQAEYDVWFRDPCTLVRNLLSNPDFKSGFDYAPYQERTTDGVHRFKDFMSANWAWKQAVSLRYDLYNLILILVVLGYHCRGSPNPWLRFLPHNSWQR